MNINISREIKFDVIRKLVKGYKFNLTALIRTEDEYFRSSLVTGYDAFERLSSKYVLMYASLGDNYNVV